MSRADSIKVGLGVLTAAIGTIPLLAARGILPSRPPAPGDAPAWIGAAIGLAFFLAGISVIVRVFVGADDSSADLPTTAPRAVRAIYGLVGTAIALLLAVLLSWVAFGPGERSFSVSGGAGGMAIAMGVSHGSELIGRIAFGFGACLAWIIIGGMTLYKMRRWLSRR